MERERDGDSMPSSAWPVSTSMWRSACETRRALRDLPWWATEAEGGSMAARTADGGVLRPVRICAIVRSCACTPFISPSREVSGCVWVCVWMSLASVLFRQRSSLPAI